MKKIFPKGFFWGSGTSAIQVEGDNNWSDWAYYEKKKPFIKSGEIMGKEADHYNKYEEDFKIAKKLNLNAHRFTIEWSRIEKEPGIYDENETEHYKKVINKLKSLGIEPFPTLHHFSNPAWFTKNGGWAQKEAPEIFAKFVEFVVNRLGNDVNYWLTINEPNTYIGLGCLTKTFPPLKINPLYAYKAAKNFIKAHELSCSIIKNLYPRALVGPIVNIQLLTPKKKVKPRLVRKTVNLFTSFYFADKMHQSSDFLGVNYYFPYRIGKTRNERTDMNWEIYPKGLYDSIMASWERYKLPVFITENGIADTEDTKRAKYITEHLSAVHNAISDGAEVNGYFYWTLLDNLELAEGYWPKFGLVEVNFKNLERKIKKSALTYAEICKNNFIED